MMVHTEKTTIKHCDFTSDTYGIIQIHNINPAFQSEDDNQTAIEDVLTIIHSTIDQIV